MSIHTKQSNINYRPPLLVEKESKMSEKSNYLLTRRYFILLVTKRTTYGNLNKKRYLVAPIR